MDYISDISKGNKIRKNYKMLVKVQMSSPRGGAAYHDKMVILIV